MTVVVLFIPKYSTCGPEVFGPFNDDNEADVWVETQQKVNGWCGSFLITTVTAVQPN